MMLLLLGCSPPPPPEVAAVLQDTDVGNVVVVEWDSEEAVAGSVSAGEGNRTPAVVATHHRHTIWGLPAGEDVTLTVEQEGVAVAETVVSTEPPPGGVPRVTLEYGGWDGFVTIGFSRIEGESSGSVVVDGQGRVVAWALASLPNTTASVWDGTAVWYNIVNVPGQLCRVPLDGGEMDVIEVPDMHHEFALVGADVVAGGGVGVLRTVLREVDGENIFGDQLLLLGFDGSERVVWDAFDTEVPERHEGWDTVSGGGDWTHANGLSYDAARGTWLVSLYWLRRVLEVDGETGQVLRRLDGALSVDEFGPQHAVEPTANGVLLFDNQKLNGDSRVAELDWDGNLAWEWEPDPSVTTLVLGDVDRLPDGRTLTAWGTDRAVIGLDASGQEAFRVRIEDDFVVGQADSTTSLYE